jgi:hypothetical protein
MLPPSSMCKVPESAIVASSRFILKAPSPALVGVGLAWTGATGCGGSVVAGGGWTAAGTVCGCGLGPGALFLRFSSHSSKKDDGLDLGLAGGRALAWAGSAVAGLVLGGIPYLSKTLCPGRLGSKTFAYLFTHTCLWPAVLGG